MSIAFADADLETGGTEAEWAELPPGPELGIRLAMVDWDALTDRELVAVMDAARRQTSWSQGRLLTAVGELSRRRDERDHERGSDAHRRIAGEVSLELTITDGQAEELLWLAEDLPCRLPATWAALCGGQLDYERAKVMAEGLAGLDFELARRLDQELIGVAIGCTRTLLRRRLTKAVRAADPDALTARHRQARDERRLERSDNPESDTCDLIGRNLAVADAHAIFNRLTAAATAMRADGDTRTVDQIRADLHRDLLRGIPLPEAVQRLITDGTATGDGAAPTAAPAEDSAPDAARATDRECAEGSATDCDCAAEAESGADDLKQTADSRTAGTGHGHRGPSGHSKPGRSAPTPRATPSADEVIAAIEALIARVLARAADEQLSDLLDRARANGRTDGLSLLVSQAVHTMRVALADLVDSWCRATGPVPGVHGHYGYRPPAAMQRLIQRRHSTCAFPTCARRAARCDLDHTAPYDKGGRTCKCNIAPLCRTHHRVIKQHPTWTLVQPWPGLLIWITPAGVWHIVTPQ
jgi:uncharacterized protein DUF222